MLAHIVQYFISSIPSSRTGRLAGNGQRIHQCLRVIFTDIDEQMMNKTTDEHSLRVNPRYQLRNDLKTRNT